MFTADAPRLARNASGKKIDVIFERLEVKRPNVRLFKIPISHMPGSQSLVMTNSLAGVMVELDHKLMLEASAGCAES
jgi:hypothetical protein